LNVHLSCTASSFDLDDEKMRSPTLPTPGIWQALRARMNTAKVEVLLPKKQLHELFEDTVGLFHQQMTALLKQNEALEQARDLLLPRLMNGAIAV
jgi:hypothetical protein